MIVSPLAESRAKCYLFAYLTFPGRFADGYQNKGDARTSMRIYVNRKELTEICGRARPE